jgi:Skp family chaperone for outer membrane proteins
MAANPCTVASFDALTFDLSANSAIAKLGIELHPDLIDRLLDRLLDRICAGETDDALIEYMVSAFDIDDHALQVAAISDARMSHRIILDLQARLTELQAAHTELKAAHTELQAAHTDLQAAHTELQAAHTDLQAAHTDLQVAHTDLQVAHTALREEREHDLAGAARTREALQNLMCARYHPLRTGFEICRVLGCT